MRAELHSKNLEKQRRARGLANRGTQGGKKQSDRGAEGQR